MNTLSPWRLGVLFLLGPLLVVAACLAERPCYPAPEASGHAGKEICLKAHVYDIVSAPDGASYLDVCPSDTAACRFTVVIPAASFADVGLLTALEGHDIQMRGTVRTSPAGAYMLLDMQRQLHGGSERFQPNPELAQGFSSSSGATAFRDPALNGRHRHGSAFSGSSSHAIAAPH